MIVLSFTLYRAQPRLRPEHVAAAVGLRSVEGRAVQVALVSLSVSLAAGLVHTWWGLGQVVAAGNAWVLAAWLLLAGGAYGLMHGVVAGRLARVLLVAGGILGVLAALGMAS
jgi:hypothetical protein